MSLIPCMGGNCTAREKCRHYHESTSCVYPVERLCGTVEEPEVIRSTPAEPEVIAA